MPTTISRLERMRDRAYGLSELNAFISFSDETGDGPVVAVKDLIDVRGTVTTAGGLILPDEPATADAPVIKRLRHHRHGVIGKTNLHEWAYGPTSHNPHYGHVRNPHDPRRIAGGSSGGSAVAVATGVCDWAIGTDTGGSIRIPASLCGVVGFKPTFGVIDTAGVFPLAPTLDTVGALAPDVRTATKAIEMMADMRLEIPDQPQLFRDLAIAVPKGWVEELDPETEAVWTPIARSFPEIAFPERERLARVALTILEFEVASLHRPWIENLPEMYGSDIHAKLVHALETPESDYANARAELGSLREEVREAMDGLDAIVVPATACVAPFVEEGEVREPLTRFVRPFNATGQPAVTVPVRSATLPVGVQVVADFGRDSVAAAVALAFEKAWGNLGDRHGSGEVR